MPNPLSLRIVVGLLAITLQVAWAEGDAASRHLFILSGQSNMTDGLEKGFSDAVRKELGEEQVTIVRSMKSGRGIRFWVEDYELPADHELHGKLQAGNGEEYPRLLKAVKDVGDIHTFDTVTFVWMQGESDANRNLAVAYGKSFTTLLGKLKSDLGLDEMRFVIGRISDHGLYADKVNGWKEMREAQVRLAEADPLGSWIDTDDLNGGDADNPRGGLHYPADKYPELGKRLGEAALKQLSNAEVK